MSRSRRATVVAAMLAAGLSSGCAASRPGQQPDPPGPGPASNGRATAGSLLPQILEVEPSRAYLDLGPVILEPELKPAEQERLIYLAARDLGADALIRESRSYEVVYMSGWVPQDWDRTRSVPANVSYLILTSLLLGMATHSAMTHSAVPASASAPPLRETPSPFLHHVPMASQASCFYRAIRYAQDTPPARPVALATLSPEVLELMRGAEDLPAQLGYAHALLGSGDLDLDAYAALRAELLRE